MNGREDAAPPPPRNNPALVGHQAAERALFDSLRSGRLAHAWLISGPEGIGKATLAYRFARFVLAGGGNGAAGDSLYLSPDHPVFRRVAAGGHSDLITAERVVTDDGRLRGEIVVPDIRAVVRFFKLTAGEGGWRVAIIDGADTMNPNAANALLKVLEEPPANSLLLLVAHNPGRLLPTIRSRCRKLALKPLAEEQVTALLAGYLPELASTDTAALAHLADGSPGRALALAAEGGLELYRDMSDILETLPDLDVQALHAFGTRFGRAGAEQAFRTAGDLIRWWLARTIVVAAGGPESGPRLAVGEAALIGRLARAAGLDRWLEVWEKINRLLGRTETASLDRKQVVLNVFLAIEGAVRP
ncbi:MAG: DNA polymerase III subunit delta' [Rhodospirillales bacterium]|nr:DNA polymerase III subunit delta' [Rhodospirillales bacterium]